MDGDLDLTGVNAWAMVTDGLELNGTAQLGGSANRGRLHFAGRH